MKNTRKILSVLLAVVMITGVFPVCVFSTSSTKYSSDGNFSYVILDDGTARIDAYVGYNTPEITIPSTVDGYTVSAIGSFNQGSSQFFKVIISEGITEIEGGFYEMSLVEEIELPDSLTRINSRAFVRTGYYYNEANWDSNALYIGDYLVNTREGLAADYTVKEGTRLIADGAFFERTELESVALPQSLEFLGYQAFFGCTALGQVEIPDGVEVIPSFCFHSCTSLCDVSLPKGLIQIDTGAFGGCTQLSEISIPQSVIRLDHSSFSLTALMDDESNWTDGVFYIDDVFVSINEDYIGKLEVKRGTRLVADMACYFCKGLTEVVLPDSLEVIGEYAFSYCTALESVDFGQGIRFILRCAFSCDNKLESLSFPESLEAIGDNTFSYCENIKDVALGDAIKSIDKEAFYQCVSIEYITLPRSVEYIGPSAFCYLNESIQRECCYLLDVYGYSDSYAEEYCEEYGINFIALDRFPDVREGDWYYEAARYNAEKGFITGYKNGNFGPADKLQRQDFIVILARIAGADLDSYDACALSDVNINAYYGKSVAWAVANDIIKGYENGKFGVGDAITREQVATILYRYMGSPEVTGADETLAPFADAGSISGFAKDAMVWAIQNGVISGKNATTLAPTASASRAEIASIIMRMDKAGMFD